MAAQPSPDYPVAPPVPFKRPGIVLTIVALFLATLVSVWAVRGDLRDRARAARGISPAPGPPVEVSGAAADKTLTAGTSLYQMQCVGCHTLGARSVGPSFAEIAARYRSAFPGEGDAALTGRLSLAAAHPAPGWDNYPPGPNTTNLTADERAAIAYWIVRQTATPGH